MKPQKLSTARQDENPEDSHLEALLSKVMLWGVLIAALIMFAGGIVYLANHAQAPTGDHIFKGEPLALRSPVAIIRSAFEWHDRSIIQFGVLILLMNPLLRVILAFFGYLRQKNGTYLAVSLFLIAILTYSLFA